MRILSSHVCIAMVQECADTLCLAAHLVYYASSCAAAAQRRGCHVPRPGAANRSVSRLRDADSEQEVRLAIFCPIVTGTHLDPCLQCCTPVSVEHQL